MKLDVAKQLIEDGVDPVVEKQIWMELGSGDGLFTYALSTLLPDYSMIYAIDMDESKLGQVRVRPTIVLNKVHSNFEKVAVYAENANGALMANALHFVKDKHSLLQTVKERLTENGRIIIVEYEMVASNMWVPYPITFESLKVLANTVGFKYVSKLSQQPSVYENRMIYSSVLVK